MSRGDRLIMVLILAVFMAMCVWAGVGIVSSERDRHACVIKFGPCVDSTHGWQPVGGRP